ncbi:MAG TPA: hypothetical protein PKD48_01805 [Sphingopyxis sp.]|nr:hypothetical protein [Sphingopyxis sp.]
MTVKEQRAVKRAAEEAFELWTVFVKAGIEKPALKQNTLFMAARAEAWADMQITFARLP